MTWYTNLIFYGGIINAFAVIVLGLVSAAIYLLGTEAEIFWRRILPASSVLIFSSFVAALILTGTRWVIAFQ